jgi:hypothetical protein
LYGTKPTNGKSALVWVRPGRGILNAVAPNGPMNFRRRINAPKVQSAAVLPSKLDTWKVLKGAVELNIFGKLTSPVGHKATCPGSQRTSGVPP